MALLEYLPPLYPYLQILYRDEDLLVLNKPSGLLSVPGKAPEHKDSLQLRVQRVFPTATVVHRLDMATSGIMLMALNSESHKQVSLQFERRQTAKVYLARVWGVPRQHSGEINLPLICDWPNRPRQMVDFMRGKQALTRWQVINSQENQALLRLEPVTGRSHQLRVHMLSLGHPILGDKLYAKGQALHMASRLQLHASELQLNHPRSKEKLHFTCHCPF